MSVFCQKISNFSKIGQNMSKFFKILPYKCFFSSKEMENWKLRESLKNCKKMNFSLWKKLKLSQNLSKVSERNQDFCCRKNLNFQWKREKISKNLSKIVRFCRKKVKDFSKIVKSVRKNLKFPSLFFQKAWIFSGKPKNFELFLLKKWIFFVKICQQWQFWAWKNFRNFAFFRKKKKMKDFQQKP